MEGQVLLAAYFSFKWLIPWIMWCCKFPEDSELLDSSLLLDPRFFVLEVFNDDIREDTRDQLVKLLQVDDDVLGIYLLVEERPQVLDNLLAVCISIHFTILLLLVTLLQKP